MLSYFLVGYQNVCIAPEDTACFLELCRQKKLAYRDFRPMDDGSVALRMRTHTLRQALRLAEAQGISVTVTAEGGLPLYTRCLWRRPGLWVGVLVVVALMILSSRFVWDVRVTGNTAVSEREVEETLRACGFGVGSYLGNFKADRIENRVLMQNRDIAWISVNMRGTVAHVEIREAVHTPPQEDSTPANLIADIGGQIIRVEPLRGNVTVAAGEWVDKGDLLIGGVYGSETSGIRYTHAAGRVYARVVEEILIEIPLTYEKKVYDTRKDAVFCEKSLIFFEKNIKFSKKTGNMGESCDIIKRVYVPFAQFEKDLPVSWVTEWYIPYQTVTATRTYAEAEELAYFQLSQRILSIPGGAEVLSKTITTTHGEDKYILSCTLECIRDIAKEQTVEVLT